MCNQWKEPSEYHPSRKGSQCKECYNKSQRERQRENRLLIAREAASSASSSDGLTSWGESLYIVSNPRIGGEVKVGRAACPSGRAQQLSQGQNFTLEMCHAYPHKGFLETTVHRRLAPWQVSEGPGREWFRLLPEQADVLVQAIILEHDLTQG